MPPLLLVLLALVQGAACCFPMGGDAGIMTTTPASPVGPTTSTVGMTTSSATSTSSEMTTTSASTTTSQATTTSVATTPTTVTTPTTPTTVTTPTTIITTPTTSVTTTSTPNPACSGCTPISFNCLSPFDIVCKEVEQFVQFTFGADGCQQLVLMCPAGTVGYTLSGLVPDALGSATATLTCNLGGNWLFGGAVRAISSLFCWPTAIPLPTLPIG